MSDSRLEVDDVLARFKQSQVGGTSNNSDVDKNTRGYLKIFLGMAPGVGKTYAMLAAGQRMATQGVDVVVGVVETHGRIETEQMLLGIDILPRLKIEYQGTTLHEFDTAAAIRRRPDILIVDELAHANAPGSPGGRQKRWQDVIECLKAGINVYTTLNIQHLESLNDVVAQITGVKVSETVPDHVFDEADEIELVDLPVDALHERIRAGKVYLGENAVRAVAPSDGFFRKGNLTALRELALRRTAAWVGSELRRYKRDNNIRTIWPAGERIIVAISPSPMSGKLVRAAKRMAAGLHADLIAAYVETPRTTTLSNTDRERLNSNIRLAESLGATTTVLAGENAARELIAFARTKNVSRIVVGKTKRPRWKEVLFGSFVDNLIRESGDIDIYVVRGDDTEPDTQSTSRIHTTHTQHTQNLKSYFLAAAMVAVVTAIGILAFEGLELANIAMVYLAAVVVAALSLGRGPAMFVAVLGVAAFDFCFVRPHWTFAVSDVQYLLTFAVMLSVGAIVGTLAARAREQTLRSRTRELTTAAQFALSRELAAARDAHEVATVVTHHAHDLFRVNAIVCIPSSPKASSTSTSLQVLAFAGSPDWFDGSGDTPHHERGVAQWAFDHGHPAGIGTQKLPSSGGRYMPLIGTGGKVGLLGLSPLPAADGRPRTFTSDDLQVLDGLVTQASSALERVTLSELQQAARLEAERERLRSALLSSVSHDLRTPLASITGAASTLQQSNTSTDLIDAVTRADLFHTIIDESARLNDIIANLVFATRLESDTVELRREWTTVEEVVGVGLVRHREALASRPFRIHIASNMPMINVDNAMLPQVIHNLVENALRYTPAGTPVSLSAWASEMNVVIKIFDEGPGLAEDEASKVFQRFYRGRAAKSNARTNNASTGMGLGLTICEGIVRAHKGRIWAEPNHPSGVAFFFSLPIDQPQPLLPRELTSSTSTDRGAG